MSSYVMAFDLGTSSLKGVLMDESVKIVASAKRAIRPTYPQPGWAESDPTRWWECACEIAADLMNGIESEQVAAVVFNAPACGIIPMTQNGNLYPSMIWLDNRADSIARQLREAMGEETDSDDVMQTTLTGKDCIPKLIWLKTHRRDLWDAMDCFVDDTGYFVWRATGRLSCSRQCACFICFDYEKRHWDTALLDAVDLDVSKFPEMIEDTDIAGMLTPQAAQELGLPAGIPVLGGFTDNQAVELGGISAVPGETMVYIGTSTLIIKTVQNQVFESSRHANFLNSANPDCHILYAENDLSGGCIDWMIEQLFDDHNCPMDELYSRVDALLDSTPPGAEGLLFTPWFHGERNPVNDVYIRGGFLNMGPSHTRAHMARAVYEGICYQICWTLDAIQETYGVTNSSIRVMGGAGRSARLMQILADVMGIPVEVANDTAFAAAKGTGMLALIGLGKMTFVKGLEYIGIANRYLPRTEYRAIYTENMQNYRAAYNALKLYYKKIHCD